MTSAKVCESCLSGAKPCLGHPCALAAPTPDPRERGEETFEEWYERIRRERGGAAGPLDAMDADATQMLLAAYYDRAPARGVTVTEEMVDRAFVSFAGCGAPHFTADDIQRWRDDLRSALTAALTPDAEGGA